MGQQFRVRRVVAVVPIQANTPVTVDLPRGYDYESIHCRIYGDVVVSVSGVAVRAEAPTQVVRRLEVIADGRNTLYSAPFWFAALAKNDRDMKIGGSRAVTPPSGFAAATYAFEAFGVIDLQTVDGERPKDSNFRTAGLQLFQLRATFGGAMDMYTAGAGTFSNAFLEISTSELVELPDAAGNLTTPAFLKKVSSQEINVTASNNNLQLRLPAGNLIKSNHIRTEGLTTAGEPTTAMLNNVLMQSGVDVRVRSSGGALRAMNNADFGPITAGYYVLDVTANGSGYSRLSELWDVQNQAEPQLVLDVVGGANGRLQAVTTEYIPLR